MDTNIALQLKLIDIMQEETKIPISLSIAKDLCYENVQDLVDSVRLSLLRSPSAIVLDLSKARSADSSGLRALLQSQKLCKQAGVDFKVVETSECVSRLIRMSGFARVFGLEDLAVSKSINAPADVDINAIAWKTHEYVATSDPSLVSVLRQKVSDAAIEAGATGEALCDIKIAAGEALTNAYRHGSPNKAKNKIFLRCMSCPNALVIEIQDEGEPFDPGATPDPDPKLLQDHGMGLYLMRQAMDVVEIHTNCPGNRIRMIKWLQGDNAEGDPKSDCSC